MKRPHFLKRKDKLGKHAGGDAGTPNEAEVAADLVLPDSDQAYADTETEYPDQARPGLAGPEPTGVRSSGTDNADPIGDADPGEPLDPIATSHPRGGHGETRPDLSPSSARAAGPNEAARSDTAIRDGRLNIALPEQPREQTDQAASSGHERNQDGMNIPAASHVHVALSDSGVAEMDVGDRVLRGLGTAGPAHTDRPSSGDVSVQRDAIPLTRPADAAVDRNEALVTAGTAVIPPPSVLVGKPTLGSNPTRLPSVSMSAPDSVLDGAQFAGVTVRAASLRGDDHRFAAETRQDSFGLWALESLPSLETDNPVLFACVADGVGSLKLSHLGSARACWLARQSVGAHLAQLVGPDWQPATKTVIGEVAAGLRAMAAEYRLPPDQVSTTLVACLVIPTPKGDLEGPVAHAVVFNVGDSPCLLLRERMWISIPQRRKEEEALLDTRTDALPRWSNRCQASTFDLFSDDMLLLCTDGLGKPMEHNPSVSEQLAEWWDGRVPSLPEFYWQMSFRAQTYGDDRSAVCVWFNGDQ